MNYRTILFCIGCCCLSAIFAAINAGAQEKAEDTSSAAVEPAENVNAQPVKSRSNSPEAAARAFFWAMIVGDREMIEKHSLKREGSEILMQSEPIPPEFVERAKKEIGNMKFRRLQPGDVHLLPDGREMTFDETMINDGRQQILHTEAPLPLDLIRVDGQWKVDPANIIRVRQAARRSMEQRRQQEP